MVARIVIAGESQCELFAQACLVADYLAQNLPNFCYERIEKSVLDWKWLNKINQKYKWHHSSSPIIWKELLMKGSKPYYIGGASDFWDYCHSYYKFETIFSQEKLDLVMKNIEQFKHKNKHEIYAASDANRKRKLPRDLKEQQNNFVICISGAGFPLVMPLISGLMEMSVGAKCISKIYLYDSECSQTFMEYVERECSFIETDHPKVVKNVAKIGMALTHTDLLIIMDHAPLKVDESIGDWLHANRKIMRNLSFMINASASPKMRILFPNLGPCCYNATMLTKGLFNINRKNVVVATSDLGLEIAPIAAEIAEVPLRNLFCPPVWGFVGINHLVDIRTTIHKYNSFYPYTRYVKVKNSTLSIGSLTPEMRTMEYLMLWDETLWMKAAEKKRKFPVVQLNLNKAEALLNVVKIWLLDQDPDYIACMGILCNGSFGINFDGVFSQPARLENGVWQPAKEFMLPKDPQMKLPYLQSMAEIVMKLEKNDLPKINPYFSCYCKPRFYKKKDVW